MSQNYMKQVNQIWYQIYQVVKENCSVEFSGNTPQFYGNEQGPR